VQAETDHEEGLVENYIEKLSFSEKVKRTIKRLLRPLFLVFYIPMLKWETFVFNRECSKKPRVEDKRKHLFITSVKVGDYDYVAKIINRFGHEDFDYIVVAFDKVPITHEAYAKCKIIYEEGLYFKFLKKYLTPDVAKNYSYLFLWDNDIDVDHFSYKNFIEIMKRNNLQMAQPALSHRSYYTFNLTLKDSNSLVGRYTDFVEVMAPIVKSEDWPIYWEMIRENYNQWGWGYDSYARAYCHYKNIGVIDQETVTHTRPLRGEKVDSRGGYEQLKKEFNRYMLAKIISYGQLK